MRLLVLMVNVDVCQVFLAMEESAWIAVVVIEMLSVLLNAQNAYVSQDIKVMVCLRAQKLTPRWFWLIEVLALVTRSVLWVTKSANR